MKAFGAERNRVVDPDACEIIIQPNGDWAVGRVRAVRKVSSESSMDLGLGEFFYQMRAALDALIYQTAIFLENSDPPSYEESLYFPFAANPDFQRQHLQPVPIPRRLAKMARFDVAVQSWRDD